MADEGRKAHPASQRGGWGIRMHYKSGGSSLNNYSLGDVVAYDSEDDAVAEAATVMAGYGGQHLYSKVTVERVEKGAWAPSEYDETILGLLQYAEPLARAGNEDALRYVNKGRALLSPYAPEHMRAALPSGKAAADE